MNQNASAQGYLHHGERPQCGNCWAHSVVRKLDCLVGLGHCTYGDFAISEKGWCAIWVPTARWLEAHPHAAAKLGMRMGCDPVGEPA